ncbi:hypothetical protein ACQEVI_08050 [Promicromonospora sp. CA-289599]|uniref:hypothetical protein n=1 Tax=Promicromonospora sp. CA-289599 TaxID=3240014 RepID=UPI003D94D1C2
MFEHRKRRLSGAKSTGVVIALGLIGAIGALGATPAIAADTEGPIQTAEVTPEATPETTPEVTPEVTPEATPEPTPEPSATDDALIEVVPAMPAITWPRCEGDKYIPPTLSAPGNSDGIEYVFEGYWYTNPFLVPIDLEVLALLKEGYTWAAEMPAGWRASKSGDAAVYEVKFEDVPCAPHNDPVVPELPVVTQAECVDGELTEPTVTLPEDGDGITYTLMDRASDPESTLDVSAKLSWSYFWAKEEKFPEGWHWSDVDVAWYDVEFDEVSCEPGAEQPAQPGAEQPEQLAATGPSDVVVLGGAALLTVAAGVSLIVVRRRVIGR